MIVQNLAVQRGQWLSFLCCYVACKMEKTICPLRRLKFILNSVKNVHAPMKPQRVISALRGWEYFAKDYLSTVFSESFVMKPIGLFKRGGRVSKSFFFEKPNETMSCFRSSFQSTVLEHAGEVSLFWVMQTFLSSKMPRNSRGKVLLIRVLYREQIMRHVWSVTLT